MQNTSNSYLVNVKYLIISTVEVGHTLLKRINLRWRPNSRWRLGFRQVQLGILLGWYIYKWSMLMYHTLYDNIKRVVDFLHSLYIFDNI